MIRGARRRKARKRRRRKKAGAGEEIRPAKGQLFVGRDM